MTQSQSSTAIATDLNNVIRERVSSDWPFDQAIVRACRKASRCLLDNSDPRYVKRVHLFITKDERLK